MTPPPDRPETEVESCRFYAVQIENGFSRFRRGGLPNAPREHSAAHGSEKNPRFGHAIAISISVFTGKNRFVKESPKPSIFVFAKLAIWRLQKATAAQFRDLPFQARIIRQRVSQKRLPVAVRIFLLLFFSEFFPDCFHNCK